MSEKMTKSEMKEKLKDLYSCVEDLSGNPSAGFMLEIHDAMKQALEHVPDDPPKYKPGDRVQIDRDKIEKHMDEMLPQNGIITLGEHCERDEFFQTHLGDRIWAVRTEMIKCLAPEPKRVPWTAEDYAERQIVHLKAKASERIVTIKSFGDVYIHFVDYDCDYESVAKAYTLPDGTELYKDVE